MPPDNSLPVFIQIKEKLKDDIMCGIYQTDEFIISTTQISKLYSVNPATAVKSVSLLQDEGIVYKKRGVGMCVSSGAREKIIAERKEKFYNEKLTLFIEDAKKLNIDKKDLINLIMEVKNYD